MDPTERSVTHGFVVVEAAALVHRRLGIDAVRVLLAGLFPAVSVLQVDDELNRVGMAAYRSALRGGSSFVDHVSFEYLRAHDTPQGVLLRRGLLRPRASRSFPRSVPTIDPPATALRICEPDEC